MTNKTLNKLIENIGNIKENKIPYEIVGTIHQNINNNYGVKLFTEVINNKILFEDCFYLGTDILNTYKNNKVAAAFISIIYNKIVDGENFISNFIENQIKVIKNNEIIDYSHLYWMVNHYANIYEITSLIFSDEIINKHISNNATKVDLIQFALKRSVGLELLNDAVLSAPLNNYGFSLLAICSEKIINQELTNLCFKKLYKIQKLKTIM